MVAARVLLAFGLLAGLASVARPAAAVVLRGAAGEAPSLRPQVIGGGASPAERDAAVLLVLRAAGGDFGFTCTATLVAANLIVTARHCVSALDDDNVACDETGKQVSGSVVGVDREVGRLEVYTGVQRPLPTAPSSAKGKAIVHDGATTLCGHDIAFVVLDRDVPSARVAKMRWQGGVTVGETFLVAGYGITQGAAEPKTRLERGPIAVRQVGPFEGAAAEPPVAPRDFLAGESFCQGDSGGPAFSTATGALIGVATRVTNLDPAPKAPWDPCLESARAPRVYAYYTQVGAFSGLAERAFAAAGREPWLEGRDAPGYPKEDDGCAAAPSYRTRASGATGRDRDASALAVTFAALVVLARRRVGRRARQA